jgi:hypothetical protein
MAQRVKPPEGKASKRAVEQITCSRCSSLMKATDDRFENVEKLRDLWSPSRRRISRSSRPLIQPSAVRRLRAGLRGESRMAKDEKRTLSTDHAMEREGVAWEQSLAQEDLSPYMPKEEYESRIHEARRSLDIRSTRWCSSPGNKQYCNSPRINYLHRRWRHCIIVSQEHDPVFVANPS